MEKEKEKKKGGLKEECKSVKILLKNKIDVDDLKAGDHIFSHRGIALNSHHGIYIGKEQVIHFITTKPAPKKIMKTCSKCGYKNDDGQGVVATCLDCFLSEGSRNLVKHSLRLYQYDVPRSWYTSKRAGSCSTAISMPPDEVTETAICFSKDNGFVDYAAFYDDDESFAFYCKTGLTKGEREDLRKSTKKKMHKQEHQSEGAEDDLDIDE